MKPSFQQVKEFFLSWGLCPSEENNEEYPNDSGDYSISGAVYSRMYNDAKQEYGVEFAKFISKIVDATDGEFYLGHETWEELEDAYNNFRG